MLRSMYSAISGLRGHQEMMDVIANNIANVNTTGFKSSRVDFADILSQTQRGATAPNGELGGINPAQVGLGVAVAGIDVLQTQGNLQSTGKLTDMAIQGDGFFVLSDGSNQYFTRDGSFDIALDGSLVNPASGLKVQGWQADAKGAIDTTQPITNLVIPIGQRTTALATSTASVRGNLDAAAPVNTSTDPKTPDSASTVTTTLTVYDSLGVSHAVTVTFVKRAANTWDWTGSSDPADAATTVSGDGTATFTADGALQAATGTLTVNFDATKSGATSPITLDAAWTAPTGGAAAPAPAALDLSQMTQFAGNSELVPTTDGFTSGQLTTFSVGNGGEITGVYSNGQTQVLGQIALASFLDPAGLLRDGSNNFVMSSASGRPSIGKPGSGGRGSVLTGSLEMSNVDLATQFTQMITAQRGFEANSRVITTSDQMLQDLVNLRQ